MNIFSWKATAVLTMAASVSYLGTAQVTKAKVGSDRERLIGTWHLVKVDAPGSTEKSPPPIPVGMIIFTADGHQAVQLMYPKEASALNNKFVHDGYEASYGTFQVDETKHLLRYRPVAANTRDAFVGSTELLHPSFPDATHLVMRPADPDQHWSVTWERY